MNIQRTVRRWFALILACALIFPAIPPARAAAAGKKLIAITFDDGPSNNTPALLDGLEARGVVATFFMCGANGSHGVVKHSDLLYRMAALGCQMANHTYSHASFAKLTDENMVSEVERVEPYLYEAAGSVYHEVVRIPGGSNTERIRANVRHPIIRWNVDPFDWRDRNEDTVYERIMERAVDGGVILLHDLYPTSIAGGLRAIDSLRAQGYEFVTVSELFRRRGIALEDGVVYNNAPADADAGTLPPYMAPAVSVSVEAGTGATVATMTISEPEITSIHYTTDGSAPTLASPLYTGPVAVAGDLTIRAAGFDRFGIRTPINEKTVRAGTAMPQIASVSRGKITLSCATEGASIYYTTNGADPRLKGTLYTRAISPGKVTKAVAIVPGRARSDILELVKTSDGSLFRDLSTDAWYYSAVDDVIKRGLMGSVGEYRFAPESPVTRAALVHVLYQMEKSPGTQGGAFFPDVPSDAWYASAVAWASANGIANGRSDGTFDPDGAVNRQQAAVMFYRYAMYSGRTGKSAGNLAAYADGSYVASYAASAVAWCEANGLMNRGVQDGRLAPGETLLREQCAHAVSVLRAIRAS